MSISQEQIKSTLSNAASAGIISSQSQSAISTELDDIGIAGCGGVDVDDIDSEEVTLVVVVIDASSSMYGHANDVLKSYDEVFLEPLRKAKNAESILVATWVFSDSYASTENVRLVHGYTPIPECPKLTKTDYAPDGSTPLYDAVMQSLAGLVTYGQNLRDNGTRVRSIAIVLSDGMENTSKVSGSKVRTLSKDVLHAQEFILSYVFFGNEVEGDKAAKDIGFPLHHRLTDDLDGSGIRRVFGQVSASVITTSQAKISTGNISANPFFV